MRIDDTNKGYWLAELFTHLRDHAARVEWGGKVLKKRANGQHTRGLNAVTVSG